MNLPDIKGIPPETGWGGIGTCARQLSHGVVKKGHRVTVISYHQTQAKH